MTPDCIVVACPEPSFDRSEARLASGGEEIDARRELRFSVVDVDGRKLTYVDLLNQAWRAGNGGPVRAFTPGDVPHPAAAALVSALRTRGVAAAFVNRFECEKERLARGLAGGPACVAIATTGDCDTACVREVVAFLRTHGPRVPVVVCGERIARFPAPPDDVGADVYVDDAHGAATLVEIVRSLKAGQSLSSVANILYVEAGALVRTPQQGRLQHPDADAIDWTLFGERDLGATIQVHANGAAIGRELESIRRLEGVTHVVFTGDAWDLPLDDLCGLLIRERHPFRWFARVPSALVDEETADLMAQSGCAGAWLEPGPAASPLAEPFDVAAAMQRHAYAIHRLKARGILTFASFVLGAPGETAERIHETADFVEAARPDYYRVQLHAYDADAVEHLERLFLTVRGSQWLPRASFDFWTLPYLFGAGLDARSLARFMTLANRLLALDIACVGRHERRKSQAALLRQLASWAARLRPEPDDLGIEQVAI